MFCEILKAILFGVIEGITEWIPVSSTGHLILIGEMIRFGNVPDGFHEMFDVVVQLGAILAVLAVYGGQLNPLAGSDGEGRVFRQDRLALWGKILLASVPAAVVGLFFDDLIDALFYNPTTVGIMLITVGAAFLIVERHGVKSVRTVSVDGISPGTAFVIGCCQMAAAVLPGTSRSGATILGGLAMGLDRRVSTMFSFFLAVPVMLGASALKLVKFAPGFSAQTLILLAAGMLTAFSVSLVCIRFLTAAAAKHGFSAFGVYRILLGAAVLILLH